MNDQKDLLPLGPTSTKATNDSPASLCTETRATRGKHEPASAKPNMCHQGSVRSIVCDDAHHPGLLLLSEHPPLRAWQADCERHPDIPPMGSLRGRGDACAYISSVFVSWNSYWPNVLAQICKAMFINMTSTAGRNAKASATTQRGERSSMRAPGRRDWSRQASDDDGQYG